MLSPHTPGGRMLYAWLLLMVFIFAAVTINFLYRVALATGKSLSTRISHCSSRGYTGMIILASQSGTAETRLSRQEAYQLEHLLDSSPVSIGIMINGQLIFLEN